MPAPGPGIVHKTRYVGRAPLVPELLSGCRKAPLMALGINPNLPGWWPYHRGALNPLFDDYRQYAHYFRYRAHAKLELSQADYKRFGGGDHDTPFSDFELDIPRTRDGNREIEVSLARQKMYDGYQDLLEGLADAMGWPKEKLTVGEDLAYGNMVASPSAKWTTKADPEGPRAAADDRGRARGHRERVHARAQVLPAPALPEPAAGAPDLQPEHGERVQRGDARALLGRGSRSRARRSRS